jgi:DNA-binding response OmpR family regulator
MSTSPTRPTRKRILVAEDDPAIRELMSRTLEREYDVVTAEDGKTAVQKGSQSPYPDLALLDVMMPGMDGLDVAKNLRAIPQLRSLPVLFVTAKSAPMDVIKGIQAGARHYITKPFKMDDLLSKVRKVLGS